MQGTVPACVFALRHLTTLHLSANGFTGQLPSSSYSPQLTDFSMSHNNLGGTIPTSLLAMGLPKLDLSHNKLTGSISSQVLYSKNTSIFSLNVNRLSGSIPSSLVGASNINILQGNLFSCTNSRKDLPTNDGYFNSYSCGSTSFDNYYYFFVALFFAFLLVLALVSYSFRARVLNEEGKLINGMQPNVIATHLWEKSFIMTDIIMGDVVFTGGTDDEGDNLALPHPWLVQLEELARKLRNSYEAEAGFFS
jgi:hypothetical protein